MRHYGSTPVIVCCSATIANPAELAEMLTGRPSRLINRTGAPVDRLGFNPDREIRSLSELVDEVLR